MPPSHILFKKIKKKKSKKALYGVAEPPQHIYIGFVFCFWIFFLNKICDGGILEKKKEGQSSRIATI
jgi:hypothetical protein